MANPPKNCEHCGASVSGEDTFCPECGAKMKIDAAQVAKDASKELPNYIEICRKKGFSDSLIKSKLVESGWPEADVERYLSIQIPNVPPPLPSPSGTKKKNPDEKFCEECGAVIKKLAEICPKCGCRSAIPLAKTTVESSQLLAKFGDVRHYNTVSSEKMYHVILKVCQSMKGKILEENQGGGYVSFAISDIWNTSIISALSGKGGTEIQVQVTENGASGSSVYVNAKPRGFVMGPNFFSKKEVGQIFDKIDTMVRL